MYCIFVIFEISDSNTFFQHVLGTVSHVSNSAVNQISQTLTNDFSDMPRLIPFHQMEEACCNALEEPPKITGETSADKTPVVEEKSVDKSEMKTDSDDIPKIAITPAMDVADLAQQIMSHMDPEKLKQLANVIKGAVESTSEVVATLSDGGIRTESTAETESEVAVQTEIIEPITQPEADKGIDVTCGTVNLAENQVASTIIGGDCQQQVGGAAPSKNKNSRKRRIVEERSGKKKSKNETESLNEVSKMRELNEVNKVVSDEREFDTLSRQEESLKMDGSCGGELLVVEKKAKERKAVRRKKSKATPRSVRKEEAVAAEERMKEDGKSGVEKLDEDDCKGEMQKRPEIESALRDFVREGRLSLKRTLQNHVRNMIVEVERQMASLELNIGAPLHWSMPWYHLNWKEVTQRFALNLLQDISYRAHDGYTADATIWIFCTASVTS